MGTGSSEGKRPSSFSMLVLSVLIILTIVVPSSLASRLFNKGETTGIATMFGSALAAYLCVWFVRLYNIRRVCPLGVFVFSSVALGIAFAVYLMFDLNAMLKERPAVVDDWFLMTMFLTLCAVAGVMVVKFVTLQIDAPFSEVTGQWFCPRVAKQRFAVDRATYDPELVYFEDIM